MFITNPEKLNNFVVVSKEIGKALIHDYKMVILSYADNGDYIFADTEKLRLALSKVGDKNK